MRKFIFAILLSSFLSCFTAEVINAQDVFGRAKKTDTEYLDAEDFNYGEVISIDTTGGVNSFVGTDIASALNTPDKIVLVILDTVADADMGHRVIYSTLADTTFIMDGSTEGVYQFIFSTSLFANKRLHIAGSPFSTVLTGDLFDANLVVKGYTHFPSAETSNDGFYLITTNTSGLVRRGILQPNTIIEITIYPL